MKIRRAEELGDDDIIEVVSPNPGRSGTYAAVRPPPLPARDHDLPRLGSIPDGTAATGVSDLVGLLARVSDPGTLPRVVDANAHARRDPQEALILTLIESNMTVEGIVGMSPLGEESTLRVLAKLVQEGTITLDD
jgi:hypothetical protein